MTSDAGCWSCFISTCLPTGLFNEDISKHLDDGIYEFRKTPRRGPALRVLWFYDEGRVIVCTQGYWKTTQRTPPGEIEKARRLRSDYLLAKRMNSLRVIRAD